MKSILKVISLIPLYFILVIFNNAQNLAIDKSFINVDFVNFPTIISFLLIALIILFWKKFKPYRKLTVGICLVTLSCVLLNGFFADKMMYKFIFLYLAMICNAYIFSKITKQRFEISIFASNAVLMLIALVLAFFNLLKIFIYVMLAIQILMLVYIAINNKKLPGADEIKFNGVSLLIFSVMFLVFVIGGINRYVHTWDEYSHWAYDAKVVATYDKLSTCEESVSSTRNYPPLMSLWQYYTSRIVGFSETNLYISLSLYILVMIMPIFALINKSNRWLLPLFTIIMFFGASLFGSTYTYDTLYADYAAAATYLTCFVIYLLYRDKDEKNKNRLLFLALAMNVLLKPTGIIAAFVLFVIMAIRDYLLLNDNKLNIKNFWKSIGKLWQKYWKLGISIVLLFVIWFGYVKVCDIIVPKYYDVKVLPESLETGISYKLNVEVIARVLYGAIESFDGELLGKYTLLQFTIVMIVVGFCAMYLNNKKDALFKILPYAIGGALYYVLTVLAIFVTFTVYEAKMVASLGRYINNFNVAIFLFLIAYLCSSDFLKNKGAKILTTVVVLFVFGSISVLDSTYFATDLQERAETRDISYELRSKFEILNEYTEEDSQVYVLDQKDSDGIMAMWYARYYGFPRRVNAYHQSIAWKIRTDKNAYDLQDWGLTAEQLSTDLVESGFDYLYLYSSDDEMFERMKFMFEDYENCRNYVLFRVINVDGHAMLEGIA